MPQSSVSPLMYAKYYDGNTVCGVTEGVKNLNQDEELTTQDIYCIIDLGGDIFDREADD